LKNLVVRLVKDWDGLQNTQNGINILQQTPNNDGIWDNILFTFEPIYKCDYLIVFNRCKNRLRICCPNGNKWLIALEPSNAAFRWHNQSYKYFDKIYGFKKYYKLKYSKYNISHCTTQWQINKSYSFLKSIKPNTLVNKKNVSFITSSKNWMSGHQKRHILVKYLKNNNYDFDLFGRGINPIKDKFDALYPYKYSIAIENSIVPHYWTDKITDCFLSWTMPIYCGAPNIFDYFPREAIIIIDPNDLSESLKKIDNAIENKLWERNLMAIKKARDLVLDKYQFFPFISNEINNHLKSSKQLKSKEYFVPSNIAPWEKGGYENVTVPRKVEWKIRKFLKFKPY
jgi:hypothetical protein